MTRTQKLKTLEDYNIKLPQQYVIKDNDKYLLRINIINSNKKEYDYTFTNNIKFAYRVTKSNHMKHISDFSLELLLKIFPNAKSIKI